MTVAMVWRHGSRHPGARFGGVVGAVLATIVMARCGLRLYQPVDGFYLVHFAPFQSVIVLVLVVLSIVWGFGFLLMAVDRLRAEVSDLALIDDLTGVANRRRLLMSLAGESSRSDRTLQPFSVLLMDIDEFKAINDGYGHAAGDECLRQFTRAVRQRLRTGDLLTRMGGDEFCVVLPATTLHEATLIARDMLALCVAAQVHWSATAIRLSTSIGVAQWRPEIGRDFDRLMAAADEALYAAKRNGKGRYATSATLSPPEAEPQMRKSARTNWPLARYHQLPNPEDIPMSDPRSKEHMEVIGADGVHVGTVDRVEGNRIKLTKADSGMGHHKGHHHFIALGLEADVESNKLRLSANAAVAVTFEEEGGRMAVLRSFTLTGISRIPRRFGAGRLLLY